MPHNIEYECQNGVRITVCQDTRMVDGMGGEIWNGAYVLSKYLENSVDAIRGKKVIELGAGCGLCGMVTSVLGANQVVLSDEYPDLLEKNVALNEKLFAKKVETMTLLWGESSFPDDFVFDIVLGSEITQLGRKLHAPLLETIQSLCNRNTQVFMSMDVCKKSCTGKCDITKCTCSHFVSVAEKTFNVQLELVEQLIQNPLVVEGVGALGRKNKVDVDDHTSIFKLMLL